jgi:hypothetical protein
MSRGQRPRWERRVTVCFTREEFAALESWAKAHPRGYGRSLSDAVRELVSDGASPSSGRSTGCRTTPAMSDGARAPSDKGGGV